MSNTPNAGIPYVPENTLDPAAGVNLALNDIDALIQAAVISMSLSAPPGSPQDGDRYIVGSSPTGAWVGHTDDMARYVSEGAFWQFFDAGDQVRQVINETDGNLYKYDGSGGWILAAGLGDAPNDGIQYVRKDETWVASDPSPVSLKEWRAVAAATLSNIGCTAATVVGTESSQTGAGASAGLYQTYICRRISVSTTAANNVASFRNSTDGDHVYGTSAGASRAAGFKLVMNAGLTTVVSGERWFMGVAPSAATAGTADPSALVNCFGIGKDGTDTNFQFMHNDGSGSATKVDLGLAFSANKFFRLTIEVPLAGGTWSYQFMDMDTGTIYSGSTSSNLPAADVALFWKAWSSTGGTGGTAAGVVVASVSQRYPL